MLPQILMPWPGEAYKKFEHYHTGLGMLILYITLVGN